MFLPIYFFFPPNARSTLIPRPDCRVTRASNCTWRSCADQRVVPDADGDRFRNSVCTMLDAHFPDKGTMIRFGYIRVDRGNGSLAPRQNNQQSWGRTVFRFSLALCVNTIVPCIHHAGINLFTAAGQTLDGEGGGTIVFGSSVRLNIELIPRLKERTNNPSSKTGRWTVTGLSVSMITRIVFDDSVFIKKKKKNYCSQKNYVRLWNGRFIVSLKVNACSRG